MKEAKNMTVSELNDFIIKNYSIDEVKKIVVKLEKEATDCDELSYDDRNFLYEGIKLCKESKNDSELEDFFLRGEQRIDENNFDIFFVFLFIIIFCICIKAKKYVDLYVFALEAFKISLSISRKIFPLIYKKLFKSAIDKKKLIELVFICYIKSNILNQKNLYCMMMILNRKFVQKFAINI